MPADGLTKVLPRPKHESFVKQLGLEDIRSLIAPREIEEERKELSYQHGTREFSFISVVFTFPFMVSYLLRALAERVCNGSGLVRTTL
jgi:hypothetical protein